MQSLQDAERAAVIAELKRASPSRGVIRETLDISAAAMELELAGAAALSVLTEEKWFLGSLADLEAASASVAIPCLRKDFMVDAWQMTEARAFGADAILLIVAALDDSALRVLAAAARAEGLQILCEVHAPEELDRAIALDCDAIGVNSRDLHTFTTSLDETIALGERLAREVPEKLRVAESAITSGEDMRRLRDSGYQAFLIGETLMRAPSPGDKLKELLAACG